MGKKPDLKALLRDDGFIEKYILGDPYIWGKFKAALIREIVETQAPATLKGGGSAQMRSPVNKPKNLEEAARMTERYLSKR